MYMVYCRTASLEFDDHALLTASPVSGDESGRPQPKGHCINITCSLGGIQARAAASMQAGQARHGTADAGCWEERPES